MQAAQEQSQPETFLCGIQPDEIDEYLPLIRPLLATVISRSREVDEASLVQKVKEQKSQIWIIHDRKEIICVFISYIATSGLLKVLFVPYLAGKPGRMDDWMPHLKELEEFGREHGCDILRIMGREGWKRVIKHDACRVQLDIEL